VARLKFVVKARRRGGPLATSTYVAYSDSAGTVEADISLTSGGAAIAGSTFTLDEFGKATIWGPPDGTSNLYLRVPADPSLGVQEVEADTDPRLDAIEAAGGGVHPNLATHDAMGLATDAELTTHAGLPNVHHAQTHAASHIQGGADVVTDYPNPARQAGYLAWTHDPGLCWTQTAPAVGYLYVMRIFVPATTSTITKIVTYVQLGGVGLTSGQNLIALYSDDGQTKHSECGDQTTPWASVGSKNMTLTTPKANTVDTFYRIVFVSNASSTAPSFLRGSTLSGDAVNVGLVAPNFRYGFFNAPNTSLPASLPAMSGLGSINVSFTFCLL